MASFVQSSLTSIVQMLFCQDSQKIETENAIRARKKLSAKVQCSCSSFVSTISTGEQKKTKRHTRSQSFNFVRDFVHILLDTVCSQLKRMQTQTTKKKARGFAVGPGLMLSSYRGRDARQHQVRPQVGSGLMLSPTQGRDTDESTRPDPQVGLAWYYYPTEEGLDDSLDISQVGCFGPRAQTCRNIYTSTRTIVTGQSPRIAENRGLKN